MIASRTTLKNHCLNVVSSAAALVRSARRTASAVVATTAGASVVVARGVVLTLNDYSVVVTEMSMNEQC